MRFYLLFFYPKEVDKNIFKIIRAPPMVVLGEVLNILEKKNDKIKREKRQKL